MVRLKISPRGKGNCEGPDTSQNLVRDFEISRFLARFRISQTSVLRRFVHFCCVISKITSFYNLSKTFSSRELKIL